MSRCNESGHVQRLWKDRDVCDAFRPLIADRNGRRAAIFTFLSVLMQLPAVASEDDRTPPARSR